MSQQVHFIIHSNCISNNSDKNNDLIIHSSVFYKILIRKYISNYSNLHDAIYFLIGLSLKY